MRDPRTPDARLPLARALALACLGGVLAAACGAQGGAGAPADAGRTADACLPGACEPDAGRPLPDADPGPDADPDPDAPGNGDADDARACAPGEARCGLLNDRAVCDGGGRWGPADPCPAGTLCSAEGCVPVEPCRPGAVRCLDAAAVGVCAPDGLTWDRLPCGSETVCFQGACRQSACDEGGKSYVGCDFFALDLDQEREAAALPVYITVSNAGPAPVTLQLTNIATLRTDVEAVEPGQVRSFALRDIQLEGSGVSRRSYRVRSDGPITVHQFNPRNNRRQVFSNDASLLLPSGALGQTYRVLGWPTTAFGDGTAFARASVAVVATRPGTVVTVTPSTAVRAGGDVPALPAGVPWTVALDLGQVLTLETGNVADADLSGTLVEASAPVAVFASHQCANVPQAVPWCDHLEQQIIPVDAWGTTHVLARFQARGGEPDLWRVVPATGGTTLQTDPPIAGVHGRTLAAGEVLTFRTRQDAVLQASGPVSVMHFMVGSEMPARGDDRPCEREVPDSGEGPPREGSGDAVDGGDDDGEACAIPSEPSCAEGRTAIGDPAALLVVPPDQFLTDYLVLTPADYARDWLTLVAPATLDEVWLDDAPLSLEGAVAVGGWRILRVAVAAGPHRVRASAPVGVEAYGHDCNVSYAYPGGLQVESLR